MSVKTITKENFSQEVAQAAQPVLVDFWAPWCVYCKRLSPVLDRLSDKLGAQVSVAKINIDEQPELAQKFDVSVIPTLYLFQQGQPGEKLVAPPSQAQIEDWIHAQVS